MKRFARLFQELDATTRTSVKVAAMEKYFRQAPPPDAAWALFFLLGHRLPRLVNSSRLRAWAAVEAGLPEWLVAECYDNVGDLAETIALLLPRPGPGTSLGLHDLITQRLLRLMDASESDRRETLRQTWRELDPTQRFLWNKLITGAFRVGVAHRLVARALASIADVSPAVMAHRLMGSWQPSAESYLALLTPSQDDRDPAQPYPFFLASPLEGDLFTLGSPSDWQAEWKWDGIRAQLIRREGQCLVWTRGEELVNHAFPEIAEAASLFPDGTVLDGELLAWKGTHPLPFTSLQRRLGRKNVGRRLRQEVPVCFMAYDLLEENGVDCRSRPLSRRRDHLERLIQATLAQARELPQTALGMMVQGDLFQEEPPAESRAALRLSPMLTESTWEGLQQRLLDARSEGTEGIMVKRRDTPYGVGRQRGPWWKCKVDPYHVDAVLVAAQQGHGRRAGLYTDYTFSVWDGDQLVPVAKAYSGLSQAEIRRVDRFVRSHTEGRFGPVRAVKPELVFELAFEGIQESSRHKSGVALRFPRIARWREDKSVRQADTLETLRAMLPDTEPSASPPMQSAETPCP